MPVFPASVVIVPFMTSGPVPACSTMALPFVITTVRAVVSPAPVYTRRAPPRTTIRSIPDAVPPSCEMFETRVMPPCSKIEPGIVLGPLMTSTPAPIRVALPIQVESDFEFVSVTFAPSVSVRFSAMLISPSYQPTVPPLLLLAMRTVPLPVISAS